MLGSFTGSVPPELYPPPPNARADTLAIKQRLAELLKPEHGPQYWSSFTSFVKGKIDRHDFEAEVSRLLNSEQLVGLHNTLVLSIFYNTTRPESPPLNPPTRPNLYTTGEGWAKRKRAPATSHPIKLKPKPEELDPKKRKLKEAVLSLGQRERNRIKQIPALKEKEKEMSQKQLQISPHHPTPLRSPHANYLIREKIDNVTNTPLASKMKISSSTLYQDYMRCQQAPLCSESKQLPDSDTLKDRMSLIAYDSGLVNGVDKSAASLALIALEVHLKTILGDILSLIRSDRPVLSNAALDPSSSKIPMPSTSLNEAHCEPSTQDTGISHASTSSNPFANNPLDGKHESDHNHPPEASTSATAYQSSSTLRLRDPKTQGLAPHLTAKDFAALSEISPHTFVRCHPGALERLIATHSFSEPCSSDDDEEDDRHRHVADLTGSSTAPNGPPWMNGTQSHSRGAGLNGAHLASPSSSRLSKTATFSPRSTHKLSGRTSLCRNNAYAPPNGSLLPVLNGKKSHHGLNGYVPTSWPDPKPNAHLFAKPGSPTNITNGAQPHSPVLDHLHSRRKSSIAHPAKSLAAELFPEDEPETFVAPPHRAGSGSESEPEEGRTHRPLKINGHSTTTTTTSKRKGWERIDTFRLLENVGN